MAMFRSGKQFLIQGCRDAIEYYSRNEHIYRKLYPASAEYERQRLALHDWNELIPEEKIISGAVAAEKKILQDFLVGTSLFHNDAKDNLSKLDKTLNIKLTRFLRVKFSKKKKEAARQELLELVKQITGFLQPSMEALHKVQFSEKEHLNELNILMQTDRFLRKVLDKVDRRVLLATTIFDVQNKITTENQKLNLESLGRKFVALMEETRQILQEQNIALNNIQLELNKETPNKKDIKRNHKQFKRSLPTLKRQTEFFAKLEKTNKELLTNICEVETGLEQAGFEYLDAYIGLPDLQR